MPASAILAMLVAATSGNDHLTIGSMAWAVVVTFVACIPIGLSLWALLDAVHRPQWAWALSRHRQVVWLIAILFGVLTLVVGLVLSCWYLLRIRPVLAAIERGDLGAA